MDFPRLVFGDLLEPIKSINQTVLIPDYIKSLTEEVGDSVMRRFCESPLGVFIKFSKIEFDCSSRLLHYLLCHSLVCGKPYELWFLIGGQPARFSLFEFEHITGLNCGEVPQPPPEEDLADRQRFFSSFHAVKETPSKEDIARVLDSGVVQDWSDDDKLRLCYLAIMADCILAIDRRTPIPMHQAKLVMDLDYCNRYPWGRLACSALVQDVKECIVGRMENGGVSFTMKGLIQALSIWSFVYIPYLGDHCGARRYQEGPPLLHYKGRKGRLELPEVFRNHAILKVKSMSDRYSFDSKYPEWESDREDDLIDNLINHILSRSPLSDVNWTVLDRTLTGEDMALFKDTRKMPMKKVTKPKRRRGGKSVGVEASHNDQLCDAVSGFLLEAEGHSRRGEGTGGDARRRYVNPPSKRRRGNTCCQEMGEMVARLQRDLAQITSLVEGIVRKEITFIQPAADAVGDYILNYWTGVGWLGLVSLSRSYLVFDVHLAEDYYSLNNTIFDGLPDCQCN